MRVGAEPGVDSPAVPVGGGVPSGVEVSPLKDSKGVAVSPLNDSNGVGVT